jgi:hypothetical protein
MRISTVFAEVDKGTVTLLIVSWMLEIKSYTKSQDNGVANQVANWPKMG